MKDRIHVTDSLPLYWRLKNYEESNFSIPETMPFDLYEDSEGLVRQVQSPALMTALEKIYQLDYNIGYIQEGYEIAEGYAEDFKKYILDHLHLVREGAEILEIGCGGATILNFLSEKYNVVGIDPSPIAVRAGEKFGIKVYPEFFSSRTCQVRPDLIFHSDVLEHVADPLQFLIEQFNVLKSNGFVVISVPDATESVQLGDISIAMHQHLQYFTLDTLPRLLMRAGFEVLNVERAKYGGSIYAIGQKVKHLESATVMTENYAQPISKLDLFSESISKFRAAHKEDSRLHRQIGFYVPLRALPYLATVNSSFEPERVRFFDDTSHWHGRFFDGTSVPIENFQDLVRDPVSLIYVMSLTFDKLILKKVQDTLGSSVEVRILRELIR
jgi:SAM-dependent methyltransferase